MARSKNFFGQRIGSTKTHTYARFKGLQITKERVSNVTQPRTNRQMLQRLKVAMVSNARSVLRDIANHSFQSTPYGYQSLSRFSSLNLAKGQLKCSSFVPKGIADCGVADYLISDGSLPTTYNFDEIIDNQCWVRFYAGSNVYYFDDDYTGPIRQQTIAFIKNVMGLEDGDQLTFILQREGDEYTYNGKDGEAKGHYHRFVISRLVIDPAKAGQWTVDSLKDGNTLTMHDGYVYFRLGNVVQGKTMVVWPMADADKLTAGVCILSRKGYMTWMRSRSRFVVNKSKDYSAMSAENVMASYIGNMTESTKYLNTGTEGVEIAGGIVRNDDLPGELDSSTHSHNQDKGKG